VKRSEALKQLSRDHHQALVVAQRLRRADDADEARETFLEFWLGHGRNHFRVEEEVLLPLWAERGPSGHPVVARVLTDHLAIRSRAGRLERDGMKLVELRELGKILERHVRLEEGELFPLIEDTLDEEALAELAEAVLQAEGAGAEETAA
jgi:hemerythrin-like domain-containing protein